MNEQKIIACVDIPADAEIWIDTRHYYLDTIYIVKKDGKFVSVQDEIEAPSQNQQILEVEFRQPMDHEMETFIINDRIEQLRLAVNLLIKLRNIELVDEPTPPDNYRGHLGDFK